MEAALEQTTVPEPDSTAEDVPQVYIALQMSFQLGF